ncbi:MAG TPA: hypothetical protein DCP90_06495 [Clostridiales bacterium]|nr:MAG: hypothetical protein A2Y22_00780 [Clostridiales bacterium GWD2_32_59]HAN10244.1 hypothetical protein [Clostridiales bacterium]
MKRFLKTEYAIYAIYATLVICVAILFEKVIGHIDIIYNFFMSTLFFIIDVLTPLIYALAIAFVLKPSVNFIEKKIYYKIFSKKIDGEEQNAKFIRTSSVFTVIIIIGMFLFGVLNYIIPQIIVSGKEFINNMPNQIANFNDNILNNYSIDLGLDYDKIKTFFEDKVHKITGSPNEIKNISLDIWEKAKDILIIFIGIILAVYILIDKEDIYRNIKKMIITFSTRSIAKKLINFINLADNVFEKFIMGKAVDSTIVGTLAFLGFLAFDLKYALLGGFVIGVSNMIPFFGPIIGAVPVVILCLLQDGFVKAIWVGVFILILQQLDGNIFEPMVLGDTLGLKPINIIIATVIGGAMFGIIGIFLGVPTFAVLKVIFDKQVEKKYKKKFTQHIITLDKE